MWRHSMQKGLCSQSRDSVALSTNRAFPWFLSQEQQARGPSAGAAVQPGTAEGTLWRGKLPKAAATIVNPRVIFPWRHDTEKLPRLREGTEEYLLQGAYMGPGIPTLPKSTQNLVTYCTANQMLQVRWYQLPFSFWKNDLANASSWSFAQAVAGMTCNLYRVPFEDIRQEEGDFSVDLKHTITHESLGSDDEEVFFPQVEDMVEVNLRKLYESAHACGRDQLQVHLQMQPTSATLLSAFVVPFLTREDVRQQPSLRHSYTEMYRRIFDEFRTQGNEKRFSDLVVTNLKEIRKMGSERVKVYDDYATFEHTVIMQVLVECDEVFSVTDLNNGKILQGHGDGKIRSIPHVVRLEAVLEVRKDNEGSQEEWVLGKWQITDWDDLLEGNIWFV